MLFSQKASSIGVDDPSNPELCECCASHVVNLNYKH